MIAVMGYLVIGAVIVGLGLLLTHVLLSGAWGRWDEGANDWFVTQRTTSLNAITSVGTTIGSTGTVLGAALVSVAFLAIRRLWREVGMIVIALAVEASVFLMTTLIVNRPRPTVLRLDPSPPTSSFPSGHTAAAIALWVSLAIVISIHVRNAAVRTIVWVVGLGLPVFVAISRLYRGMHHPTDVMGSVVLGAGAILTALLAVKTASAVAEIRREPPPVGATPQPARIEVAS
jgi:membrane-associated phospholipid phosphatase